MAFLNNDVSDIETDVHFGRVYFTLSLTAQSIMALIGLMTITDQLSTPDAVTEFIKTLLVPSFLALHTLLVLGAVYLAKRATGHKRSLALPHHTKPIKGDPTKGPFIRRTVLKVKAFIFKISPLKTVLHGAIILTSVWLLVVYVVVCFGAPALSEHLETASFAYLLVILSAFPILLIYGPETDSYGGLTHVILSDQDNLKTSDPLGHQLFISCCGAIIGSWIGAIPIPLDWDRPWQKWPVSCACGALMGSFLANSISLIKLHFYYKRYCSTIPTSKKKRT